MSSVKKNQMWITCVQLVLNLYITQWSGTQAGVDKKGCQELLPLFCIGSLDEILNRRNTTNTLLARVLSFNSKPITALTLFGAGCV